jgi:hypothetical protein
MCVSKKRKNDKNTSLILARKEKTNTKFTRGKILLNEILTANCFDKRAKICHYQAVRICLKQG